MKSRIKIVLSTSFIILVAAFSAVAGTNAPFSNAPAPTQAYHTISIPTQQSAQSTTQAATQTTAQATTETVAPTVQTQDYLSQPTVANAQSETTFEQTASQDIQNLNSSNQEISSSIQTLNQNVAQLQQEVNILQTTQMKPAPKHIASFKINAQNADDFMMVGGAAAFLLFFGVIMGRMMRRSPATLNVTGSHRVGDVLADDAKSDYDFMNSTAAIPAKLDLARSYIAMNDHDQARAALKTVLEKGDEEQRMVAEALLNKIQKP